MAWVHSGRHIKTFALKRTLTSKLIGLLVNSTQRLLFAVSKCTRMINKLELTKAQSHYNGLVPRCCMSTELNETLEFVIIKEEDVNRSIVKLKSSLSAGPDNLPPLLYKKVRITACTVVQAVV